jgi:uncharacterized repeat protein (TIGR01451 family)
MRAARNLSLSVLMALAAPAAAQDEKPRVVIYVDVQEEVAQPDARGNVQLARFDVERADPGDVLVYKLTYTNTGSRPAVNAKVDDPIPAGTVLVPGSVSGEKARITFSIDGGRTYVPWPATVSVPGPDGSPTEVEAPAERYTHIRWSALTPLAPGESRTASFKVLVR